MKIFNPIVEHLKLQMRLNLKTRQVELKVTCYHLFAVNDIVFNVTINPVYIVVCILCMLTIA